MKNLVVVTIDNDHPNGFPGGDPNSVEKDYEVSVDFNNETLTVSGELENVRSYLEDYALTHLLD